FGAGLTVTVAVALVPAESWAVIRTAVSARALAGRSTIVPLVTYEPRVRIAVLIDTTKYGGTPPTTVKVAGVFEKTVAAEGRMERGPGVVGGGLNGLFGAPLPPPQPPRTASVANASRAEMNRSQRAFIRFGAMNGSLMICPKDSPVAGSFERCDKHIGDFVQIKAQVCGRRKCFRQPQTAAPVPGRLWLPRCNNMASMREVSPPRRREPCFGPNPPRHRPVWVVKSGEDDVNQIAGDSGSQPPAKQGLYDPRYEHDACGLGFIVHIKGR